MEIDFLLFLTSVCHFPAIRKCPLSGFLPVLTNLLLLIKKQLVNRFSACCLSLHHPVILCPVVCAAVIWSLYHIGKHLIQFPVTTGFPYTFSVSVLVAYFKLIRL